MEELAALSAEKRKLALTRFLLIEHTLSVAKERRSVRASESPRTTHNPKISTTNNFSSYNPSNALFLSEENPTAKP